MSDMPPADPNAPATPPGPPPGPPTGTPAGAPVGVPGVVVGAPNSIRFPLLIGGILNGLVFLTWAAGCITIVIGIPLAVLAVFEILLFIELGKPDYHTKAKKVKIIQILEICSVLLGSIGAMICGILGLVFAGQERQKGTWPAA